MGRLQGGDDAFQSGQLESRAEGLVVIDGHDRGTVRGGEVGMQRADAGIVESGREGVGFDDLPVLVLHHEGAAAVYDAQRPTVYRGRRFAAVDAVASGFAEKDAHPLVINVVVYRAGGVRTSAHAGHQVVGIVAAFLFQELLLDFAADDALQTGHQVGVGMRPHGGADDVERVRRVATPVADGLVRGILQRLVAALHGINLRAQHLHAFHVDALPLHVRRAHIDPARHVHQGADGGCGHAVLPRARFGDDAFLAHGPCQEDLPNSVVDFVCPGVVQVFTLQVELAAVFLAHAAGKVEGRRPSHVVFQ